jgi:hypothetical protein
VAQIAPALNCEWHDLTDEQTPTAIDLIPQSEFSGNPKKLGISFQLGQLSYKYF